MDFFGRQDQHRGNTLKLLCCFALAVAAMVAVTYFGVMAWLKAVSADASTVEGWWNFHWFLQSTIVIVGSVMAGTLFKVHELRGGGSRVALQLGGRLVPTNTSDPLEKRLLNTVEEMALASGCPVPPVYILPDGQINAFAAGYEPGDAVIGITRGAVEQLSRDELQAVVAHEFSHILNGDMRLNLRLIGVLFGIEAISVVGGQITRFALRASQGGRGRKRGLPGIFLVIGLLLLAVGMMGLVAGRLIKSAISRQREFLADAAAVQFTRNPGAVTGALKKIGQWLSQAASPGPAAFSYGEVSHMLFVGATNSWLERLLATHPPLDQRIRAIEPGFGGKPGGATEVAPAGESDVPSTCGFDSSSRAFAGAPEWSLNATIETAARDPFSARALVLSLLVHGGNPAVRERQMTVIDSRADPSTRALIREYQILVDDLSEEQKLIAVELAASAQRQSSPAQQAEFCSLADMLISADREVTCFEYAVFKILTKRLCRYVSDRQNRRQFTPQALGEHLSVVLSTLAVVGHQSDVEARRSFGAGMNRVPGVPADAVKYRTAPTLHDFDVAMECLARADETTRSAVLSAAGRCVMRDGRLNAAEAALIRALSACLDLPMTRR